MGRIHLQICQAGCLVLGIFRRQFSRFTLHAITEEQEDELLGNILGALDVEGIFVLRQGRFMMIYMAKETK